MTVRKISIGLMLFFISVVVLFVFSERVDPQATADASYYNTLANGLIRGEGFHEPFIWQHLNNYEQISHPIDYWMPLVMAVYALAIYWGGPWGGIYLNMGIWSLLSVLVFFDVFDKTKRIMPALLSYAFLTMPCRMIFFLLTTDNIAFYACIGYALFRAIANNNRLWLKAGITTGLAILTRIDGIIFTLLTLPVVFIKTRNFRQVAGFLAIVALIVLPWAIRNKVALGSYWPSNSKSLLLTDYEDFFYPDFSGSVQNFLSQGWHKIVEQRTDAFKQSILDFVFIPSAFIFLPFWFAGIVTGWKDTAREFVYYFLSIIIICSVFFPFQTLKGTSMHISAFFFPCFASITGLGFNAFIEATAAKKWLHALILLICCSWIFFFTIISVRNYANQSKDFKAVYKDLFMIFRPAINQAICARDPIFVYELTGCRGVIWSKRCPLDPVKTADKYGLNYIIVKPVDPLPDAIKEWSVVASTSSLIMYQRNLKHCF